MKCRCRVLILPCHLNTIVRSPPNTRRAPGTCITAAPKACKPHIAPRVCRIVTSEKARDPGRLRPVRLHMRRVLRDSRCVVWRRGASEGANKGRPQMGERTAAEQQRGLGGKGPHLGRRDNTRGTALSGCVGAASSLAPHGPRRIVTPPCDGAPDGPLKWGLAGRRTAQRQTQH